MAMRAENGDFWVRRKEGIGLWQQSSRQPTEQGEEGRRKRKVKGKGGRSREEGEGRAARGWVRAAKRSPIPFCHLAKRNRGAAEP